MPLKNSQKPDRVSDWIVIPATAAIAGAVWFGIFSLSMPDAAVIGWLLPIFVIFIVAQRIGGTKNYGSSVRVGIALGAVVSYMLVRWLTL